MIKTKKILIINLGMEYRMASVFGMRADERVCVFIDGPALHNASKKLGANIDYTKLRESIEDESRLNSIHFFTGVSSDSSEQDNVIRLIDFLSYNGFRVHKKLIRNFTNASGRQVIRCNLEIDIATAMFEVADFTDHYILFSGDEDYKPLIESLQRRGKHITIVASNHQLSPELRKVADYDIPLEEIIKNFAKQQSEDTGVEIPFLKRTANNP